MGNNLSANFKEHEFFGNPGQIDQPTQLQLYTASRFCIEVLEPLRDKVGTFIKITDGSRHNPKYGSSTSQHLMRSGRTDDGIPWCDCAADINFGGGNAWVTRMGAIKWLYDNRATIPFSQVIWYPGTTHLHIGYQSARLAQQGRLQFAHPEGGYPDVTPEKLAVLDAQYRTKGGPN